MFWAPAQGKAVSLGLGYSVPGSWKLVSAQSLVITVEDFVSSRSHRVSGAWEVLAASPYPGDDYWMWRIAAKNRKTQKNWRTLCKVRFVTFSTFISLQYILLLSCFTSCMLFCTERGRTFWPCPPKTGVAMTGLSPECANVREHALFKCIQYQHFVFYQIFHWKRGLPLLTEAGAYCVKEQAVEIRPITNSALCYVNVGLPRLTLFRMERKLWSSSAWFNWSLFMHSPLASREDFKLKFLNWTSPSVSSFHQKQTSKRECRFLQSPWMSRKPRTAVSLCQCLAASAPSQPRTTGWKLRSSKLCWWFWKALRFWKEEESMLALLPRWGSFPHPVTGGGDDDFKLSPGITYLLLHQLLD